MDENQHYSSPNQPGRGRAIAALILGILSIVFCWGTYIGIILGILGIIFGALAKKTLPDDKLGKVGFILGIIGLILSIIITIIYFVLGAALMSAYGLY